MCVRASSVAVTISNVGREQREAERRRKQNAQVEEVGGRREVIIRAIESGKKEKRQKRVAAFPCVPEGLKPARTAAVRPRGLP